MGKPMPVFTEVVWMAERRGWSQRRLDHPNHWRYERDDTVIDVTYTFGGNHGIQTIHVMRPDEERWIHFRAIQKRQQLLDLLNTRPGHMPQDA